MKGLYAYFGLLDLHTIDSPGHSFYQLGLMDSICQEFGINGLDFFSYYPENEIKSTEYHNYPDTQLGKLFTEYLAQIVEKKEMDLEAVVKAIAKKEYKKLFLKARFRNLSTLTKKWKDASYFEEIIDTAIHSGYAKEDIIILDTDLSLSDSFVKEYESRVTIKIPSIDFPGISMSFLDKCIEIRKAEKSKEFGPVFYGNIDTTNYKSGNAKSEMLGDVLTYFKNNARFVEEPFTIISKGSDIKSIDESVHTIDRRNRHLIWDELERKSIMLNVTKAKYAERKFIPARIYEALIFGMIPVSYDFEFLSNTFSFSTMADLNEIIRYLKECSQEDLTKAYLHFVNQYKEYEASRILSITTK